MSLLHRLASVIAWIFRRDQAEQQLDDEIRAFVAMATADKIRDGVPAADARRLALVELGGLDQVKEHVRSGRHGAVLDDLGRDARYAFRLFARQPTFAIVIVGTLALGIGANTAVFSIVDSLLLRTLPIHEPERLARLVDTPSGQQSWTYPIWEELQRHADRFDGAFAWSLFDAQFNLAQGGETQYANGVWASGSSFEVLGVRPLLGRLFVPSDDRRGGGEGGPVAVISHAFWQKRFGGARDVIGRTLTLERTPVTIIGVTPPGFFGLTVGRSFDVAVPFGVEPLIRGTEASRLNRRTSWWLSVLVRLKRGQAPDDASAVVRTLQPAIREATLPPPRPGDTSNGYLSDPLTFVSAAGGQSGLRENYRRPLLIMMVVVGLVLLIACANIANLLLARATARGHEWSVRLALGASRGRLARQLLIESLLLAAIGAAAGVIVAQWGSELLVRQLGTDAVYLDLPLDWRMLGFTAAVTVVAAIVFGVAPAVGAARRAPIDAMRDRGRNNAGSGRITAANSLVLTQVVLSLVLVMGAVLFLRSFGQLTRVPLGFDTERVLLAEIDARRAELAPTARRAEYERIRQRVLEVPGVVQASVSIVAPLSGAMWSRRVDVSGSTLRSSGDVDGPEGFGFTDRPIPENSPLAVFNGITPGWIATFGTPLLAGRDISERDGPSAPAVALVNLAFARKFLNGANPIGHTIQPTRDPGRPAIEIVGLLTDAVYRTVREATLPTVYIPLAQSVEGERAEAPSVVTLSVRAASAGPAALTKSVAAAIGEINPMLALTFQPLDTLLGDTLMRERLLAILSAAFGALALLMAAVGLYGVTSYSVNLRRTEIGIRMALGATRASVIRLVLGRVSLVIGAGIVVGLAIGTWASRFIATLLFGLEPGDPSTLVASAATLAFIGTVAGWLPANRASRLDPTQVLHDI
jgi:putative ABC transport system permease protein